MAPLRVSTTKSEWLPDDPTAFVPTRLWKLPFITTWDDSRNQNRPTDSAEEAELYTWPQVLPDGKHLLYTVFDARSGHYRARVVKLGETDTTRDLVETDSRTLYAPSLLQPEAGYLLYVRAGNILAHPFDPRS